MTLEPLMGAGRVRARNVQAGPLCPVSWIESRILFDHRRWACADAELRWTAGHHLLVLTEQGGTSQTLVRFAGRLSYEGRDRPGALTFVPASVERQCSYRNADLVYSALWIDPSLQNKLCADGNFADIPMFVNASDGVLSSLLAAARAAIAEGQPPSAAYMEHMAALILLRLATLRGGIGLRGQRGGRLSRKALARLEDYIEAHLGADITLSDLAGLLDLPIDAFARRFKATTGRAPYAYVIERRVRRAELLLTGTDMELASIGLSLGFSSQSHFTTTFRRMNGATPRAYRAQFAPDS